jgi:hypothetical protein
MMGARSSYSWVLSLSLKKLMSRNRVCMVVILAVSKEKDKVPNEWLNLVRRDMRT